MAERRIIFVDDNQGILDGLRRALRPERNKWFVSFVTNGEEALELMSQDRYDALVTDMRMPGIGGVQLLDEVTRLYPDMVRFILSGHAKEDMTLQSVKSAHQFFPKPCNIDSLKTALVRAFTLRELLADPKLQALVSGIKALPSVPHVYTEIVGQLNSPEVSVHVIGETIAKDPAISAKILQLVNSAFFGLGRHVSNPGEAATLLGLNIIKHLVLSVGLFSQFDETKLNHTGFILEEFINHSMRVGILAKQIAITEEASKEIVDESYLSGFLHDIGKLILVDNMSDEYSKAANLEQSQGLETNIVEKEIFGTDHAAIGAYLFGLWGFSNGLLEAVAFHHTPGKSEIDRFTPLTAVHIANALDDMRTGKLKGPVSERLDLNYLSALGLGDRIEMWQALVDEEVKE